MTSISIYRPGTPPTLQATVSIDASTVYLKKLMGEHKITSEFYASSALAIQIGDYITYNTENYYINRLPDIEKINSTTLKYKIDFESVLYNLSKKLFISSDGLADFSYNGTASDFIDSIISNINEIDPTWTKGTVDSTDYKTLQFTNESCRAALTRIAEAFSLEFTLSGREISLVAAAGSTTAYTFEYGKNNGLYKLTRQQVNDQNIVTKVYGFGGEKNIPSSYRTRAKRLVFESAGNRYLTKNTDLYGTIEGQYTNDDIYPNRTSTLTGAGIAFDDDDLFDFKTSYVADSTIDFDLNDYLIEGKEAKIVFKTGDLAGVECTIWKYDNTNKRIYFNPYSDTDGYTTPNYNGGVPVQPEIGDSYTLVDISLPQSYIDTAETALQTATQAYLDENSVPMVVYSVEIDQKYAATEGISLNAGDKVTVTDTDLGIDTLIRIAQVQWPLVNEYDIKAVIADFVPYTLQERIVKTSVSTKKEAVFVDRRSAELARRNVVRQKQLQDLLFDTDGYFDPVNLKPLSVETMYLAVGAKSQNFRLSGVTIEPNKGGNANSIDISSGSLVHFDVSITGLGYTWVIGSDASYTDLTPASAYYLYAKCSQAALTGEWLLTTDKKTADGGDGYYYFLCGVLYAVYDGARDYDFTFGMTYINGRVITTGKIRSIDGFNYIDLDNNQFRIGNATSWLDWNVTTANTLTLKGVLAQSPAGTTAPLPVFRGAYAAGTTYYKGDQVTYGGSSWQYINSTAGAGHTPAEDSYWTKVAAKGTDGTNGTNGTNGSNGLPGYTPVKGVDYYDGDKGDKGDTGNTGPTGPTGPGICYRGYFNASTPYYYSSARRDVVNYNESYYVYRGANGSYGAWSDSNWEAFGATFSAVATEILLATFAYVENLGVRYFKGASGANTNYQGISINGREIYESDYPGDGGSVLINYRGYNNGFDYYRNTSIYDGRGNPFAIFEGSTHMLYLYGDMTVGGDADFAGTIKVPRLTQTQINALSPSAGMIVYNTTNGHFYGFTNVWRQID